MKYSNDYTTNNSQEQITGTIIPNWILDNLHIIPILDGRIILFIIRRTWGWHKETQLCSISFIENGLGYKEGSYRTLIIRSIRRLLKLGVISRSKSGNSYKYSFSRYIDVEGVLDYYTSDTDLTANVEKKVTPSALNSCANINNNIDNNINNNIVIKKENNIKEKKKWKSVECLDTIEFVQALKSKFSDNPYLAFDISGLRRWLRDERNLSKHPRNYLLFAYNWVKKANQFRADRLYRQRMQSNVDEHQRMVLEENKAGNRPAFQLKSFGYSRPSYLN